MLPNSQIRVLLQIADERARQAREVELLNDRVIILQERILSRDSLIAAYKVNAGRYEGVIGSLKMIEENLLQQRALLEGEVKRLNKSLKRQKRKTFLTSLSGFAAASVAAILLLK